MLNVSPVILLRKVCKLGRLHYKFMKNKYGFKALFTFYYKSSKKIDSRYPDLVKFIQTSTYRVPDEIESKESLADWALFNTHLLERVFKHKILTYEQLLCELDLNKVGYGEL